MFVFDKIQKKGLYKRNFCKKEQKELYRKKFVRTIRGDLFFKDENRKASSPFCFIYSYKIKYKKHWECMLKIYSINE